MKVPENHPSDRDALTKYADGTHFTTCLDENSLLLFDMNRDGELDLENPAPGSFAFIEESGRGVNNEILEKPFSNLFYSTNYLAQYMTMAYNNTVPAGLYEAEDYMVRWRIVGGNPTNWYPYEWPR